MALKDTVREYLEMLDSPGFASRRRDELLAEMAAEAGYERPQLSQEEISSKITFASAEGARSLTAS